MVGVPPFLWRTLHHFGGPSPPSPPRAALPPCFSLGSPGLRLWRLRRLASPGAALPPCFAGGGFAALLRRGLALPVLRTFIASHVCGLCPRGALCVASGLGSLLPCVERPCSSCSGFSGYSVLTSVEPPSVYLPAWPFPLSAPPSRRAHHGSCPYLLAFLSRSSHFRARSRRSGCRRQVNPDRCDWPSRPSVTNAFRLSASVSPPSLPASRFPLPASRVRSPRSPPPRSSMDVDLVSAATPSRCHASFCHSLCASAPSFPPWTSASSALRAFISLTPPSSPSRRLFGAPSAPLLVSLSAFSAPRSPVRAPRSFVPVHPSAPSLPVPLSLPADRLAVPTTFAVTPFFHPSLLPFPSPSSRSPSPPPERRSATGCRVPADLAH
jgi:hypothetical protein